MKTIKKITWSRNPFLCQVNSNSTGDHIIQHRQSWVAIPSYVRSIPIEWWEEDCDWAVP